MVVHRRILNPLRLPFRHPGNPFKLRSELCHIFRAQWADQLIGMSLPHVPDGFSDGAPVRQSPVRQQIRNRHQHEEAFVHARMRKRQHGIVGNRPLIGNHVQIERSGRIDNTRRPNATVCVLNRLTGPSGPHRFKRRLD